MRAIVTLEAIKRLNQEKQIDLPSDAVVTGEARAWAEKQGIKITVGGKLLPPLNRYYKSETSVEKVVITVIGEDKVGIIAGVSSVLSEHNVNILDINQTSLEGLFAMVMIADASESTVSFEKLKEVLVQKGNQIGVRIDVQHEEVFRFMQRI